MHLSVLTLNCWGVHTPLACDLRKERITAIAEELQKGTHDIVALQEIWSDSDGEYLEETLSKTYPHHHRWHSQLIGAGLCLFSKWPILDTSFLRYTLNGYAHNVQHGDWWGGKGVGVARIACNEFRINVYVTHLIAQYHEPKDEYQSHRVSQMFELAHHVRMTSETCDAVLVTGDMNSRPDSVAYRLLVNHAILKDAWTDQKIKATGPGYTSNVPTNTFLAKYWMAHFPEGERLDYIFYRNNQGCTLDCDECQLTFQKIPGKLYNYSDHEGVCAKFYLRRNPTAMPPEVPFAVREKALTDAVHMIQSAEKRLKPDIVFFCVVAIVALAFYVILGTDDLTIPVITEIVRFMLTLVFWYSIAHALLAKRFEWNGYRNVRGHLMKIKACLRKIS